MYAQDTPCQTLACMVDCRTDEECHDDADCDELSTCSDGYCRFADSVCDEADTQYVGFVQVFAECRGVQQPFLAPTRCGLIPLPS
jgi:hypothetical protein